MNIDIEQLVPWKNHGEKSTRQGPKILWKAPAPEGSPFWDAWRSAKPQMKAAGVSCSRDDATGRWEACWWRPISREIVEKRNAAIEESKAVDVDIEIPVPDGLAYRPFQKAGIVYALKRFGFDFGTIANARMGHAKRSLSTDEESTGSISAESSQRSGTRSEEAGRHDTGQDRSGPSMEAASFRLDSGEDARPGGAGSSSCWVGQTERDKLQGRERATVDGSGAASSSDFGTARIQTGGGDTDGRTRDGSAVSPQLQGRLRPPDPPDGGGTGRSFAPRKGEAVGGFKKDNGADSTRLASDQDQTRKGGMPTPSRGDSCGVLIADEMG